VPASSGTGLPGLLGEPVIAVLPLDDRPCNLLFPAQLARIGGWEVLLPPRELLGWFTRPGDCRGTSEWLRACPADRFIVSLDMLCYGGLVAGRTSDVPREVATARLAVLRHLRRSRPDAVIFAFSNLMRLGLTVTSPETLETHLALAAYSQLADRVNRLGDDCARGELDSLLARLDPEVLADYLAVRARNHALNLAAVELAAEGVLDYLVLPQEDAAPAGLHLAEQAALRAYIAQRGVAGRVAIHSGADEVGLVLLARQVGHAAGYAPRIAPEFASPAGAAVTPLYEHQSLRLSVESQIRAAGAGCGHQGEADAIMLLHTSIGPQREAAEAAPAGGSPGLALQADAIVASLQAGEAAGSLIGLADVAYANGADPALIAALCREHAGDAVHAFAAWNTAGNTIGTVIANLCLAVLARKSGGLNRDACASFVALRMIDDYGYQSCVRPRALARAREQGANPYALGDAGPQFAQFVRDELLPLAHSLCAEALPAWSARGWVAPDTSLPWNRLFEVAVALPASSDGPKNRP